MEGGLTIDEIRMRVPASQRVTLVGGAFDLLHIGHLRLLEFAASIADVLVVAVLSDRYISSSPKGPSRPIVPEAYRAALVGALRVVDYAYVSDRSGYDATTLDLLRPAHLVFGVETGREEKVLERIAQINDTNPGVLIHRHPRFPDETVSTSAVVRKIVSSTR